ncbi:MAG: hypothetical protein H6685_12380 [Deltaproteobacteria bacterium]|nr:hypothetical protein [Deltaproteobacteria bacterium]
MTTNRAKKIAFAALAVAAALVGAELILRAVTPPIDQNYSLKVYDGFLEGHTGHQADHDLFWRLTPGFRGVWDSTEIRVNQLGLRGEDFPAYRVSGEFRLLSLGESGTFGVRTPEEQTYNAQLEALLNARGDGVRYRVMNAGVASYTSFQGRKYFEMEGRKLEPNVVLVYFGQNDNLPTYFEDKLTITNAFGLPTYGRGMTDAEIWRARHRAGDVRRGLMKSALYRNWAAFVLWIEHGVRGRPVEPTPRVPPEDRRENYQAIDRLAKGIGARVLYLITPYFDQPVPLPDGFGPGSTHHVCDLWTGIRREGQDYRELFSDDVHPTSLGHRLIAETIAECLADQGLLPTTGE